MMHNIQKTENPKKKFSVPTQSTLFTTRMPKQQMQQFLSDLNSRTPFAAPGLADRSDAMIVCIASALNITTHLLLMMCFPRIWFSCVLYN